MRLTYRAWRAVRWAEGLLYVGRHVSLCTMLALAAGAVVYYGLGFPTDAGRIVSFNAAVSGIHFGVSVLAWLAVRHERRMRRRWLASERLQRRHVADLSGGSIAP